MKVRCGEILKTLKFDTSNTNRPVGLNFHEKLFLRMPAYTTFGGGGGGSVVFLFLGGGAPPLTNTHSRVFEANTPR